DDDGERMVACDLCVVWQHTLCSGIDDDEAVPPLFICYRSSASSLPEPGPDIEPSLLAASSAIFSSDGGMASFACTSASKISSSKSTGFQEWICLVYTLEHPSDLLSTYTSLRTPE
nr:PHD finger protein MALE MEIOCYTE DEATH 1 [Tanacetum cinerariifolium]